MRPDEHVAQERSMAKHHALDTAGGRAWLADHDAELTEQVRARVVAETRERVLRELGFHDETGTPVRHRERDTLAVTPHLPTLALVAHRIDEFAKDPALDADGSRPYEEMTPDEALFSVIANIRGDVEILADPSRLANPADFPAVPFAFTHQWRHRYLSYEQLGQTKQACLCGEWRTMYATEMCDCARTEVGTLGENSGHCVVHPLPGCPNPACGDTWIASFHGDHCDSCGWTSSNGTHPDGTPVVDMAPRALAWARAVFPKGVFPLPFPDHWAERVITHCASRPAPPKEIADA